MINSPTIPTIIGSIRVSPSSYITGVDFSKPAPIDWWRCNNCGDAIADEWDEKKVEKCFNCGTSRYQNKE